MQNIQESNCASIISYLDKESLKYEKKESTDFKRINVINGIHRCNVTIYSSGKILVQGKDTPLRTHLKSIANSIEEGKDLDNILPYEIEDFPKLLKDKDIDPIIIRFIEEAIKTLKAGSNLGAAFLLGAASEKAILLLISSYTNAIENEAQKEKFEKKLPKNSSITKKFGAFRQSYNSSINKPKNEDFSNDLDTQIEQIFQFCRICRNEAGHPNVPQDLNRGTLTANMGQFVKYIEKIYKLIEFYKQNPAQLN